MLQLLYTTRKENVLNATWWPGGPRLSTYRFHSEHRRMTVDIGSRKRPPCWGRCCCRSMDFLRTRQYLLPWQPLRHLYHSLHS